MLITLIIVFDFKRVVSFKQNQSNQPMSEKIEY